MPREYVRKISSSTFMPNDILRSLGKQSGHPGSEADGSLPDKN